MTLWSVWGHLGLYLSQSPDPKVDWLIVRQKHLSDKELVGFSSDDFTSVRVAISAYGIHLFGKVRIPAMADSDQKYIHFRAFTTVGEPPKLHSIHTEEKVEADGNRRYRAIFTEDDPLEWFDT